MSARLSFCLKAATTLEARDLEQITASIEAYANAGMAARQAEAAAVDDLIAEVDGERVEMIGLLREQHAGVFAKAVSDPESEPAPAPAPAYARLGEIGENADGDTLTEDERGVRTLFQPGSNVGLTEKVNMVPTRGTDGKVTYSIGKTERRDEYKTVAELAADATADAAADAAKDDDFDAMFDELLAEETAPKPAPKTKALPATVPGPLLGTHPMVQRQEAARARFIDSVVEQFGLTAEQAARALDELLRVKMVKLNPNDGQFNLKDGRFWTAEAMQSLVQRGAAGKGQAAPAAPTRTATQAAASAAVNSAKALGNAIDGLGKLMGGGPGKLGAGLSFDEETYAKAKPLFIAALANLKDAASDLREAMRTIVGMVVERFGVDTAKNLKPYVVRFITDVREGRIALSDTANQEAPNGSDHAGADGAQTLGAVAAPEGGGAEGRGDAERGDTGSGVSGPAGDRGTDEPGVSGVRSGGSGSTSVRAPKAGTGRGGRSRGKGRAGRDGGAVPAGDEAVSGPGPAGPGQPGLTEPVSVPNLPALNFRITPDLRLGKGGEVEKFNDNIAAITALKAVEAEGRHATPAEQRLLARYVGWGGLANAFPNPETKAFRPEWDKRGKALAELLTPKEYQLARRSTLDSYFTSQDVVAAMWVAARRLGFKGGVALETSMGSGNFLGLMPDALVGNTRFVGVEYDSLTARIAALLYPQETVLNAGFQEVPLSDGSFDLNIGNPPFGDQSLRFQFKPGLNGVSIHNQFIRAALDALKPGGLQIQVVSRYLMDKQDKSDRVALAKKARLLGAIRLPDTAFKENALTEVVTDILFLQRLTPAEEAHMDEVFEAAARKPEKDHTKERDRWLLADQVPAWVNTVRVRDPLGGDAMVVGSYFDSNPHMILGTLERSGTMQFGGDITVRFDKGASLPDALAGAIGHLPQDVMQQEPDAIARSLERFKGMSDALRIALAGHEAGAIAIDKDGKLHQVVERLNPQGDFELAQRELTPESPWSATLLQTSEGTWYTLEVPLDAEGKPAKVMKGDKPTKRNRVVRKDFASEADISASLRLGAARFERLKKLVALRDLFVKQINLETEDAHTAKMEGNRAQLAAAYKAFTDAHGWISDPANSALVGDMPDGALVQALETDYAPAITALRAKTLGEPARAATAKPSPILTQRVIPKYEPPGAADSPADALQIALSEFGRVNLERMAALLGKTEEEVIAALHDDMAKPLIFKDPETGTWQTRNDYLSGQVRRKLIAARAQGLPKNVEALEAVQPALWGAENVTALVGSTWVPPAIYADFYKHMTGQTPHISFAELTNTFAVRMPAPSSKNHNDEWGSDGMRVETILEKMLNTQPVRVYDQTDDGPQVNHELTKLAQLKATQIATEFDNWVFDDGTRRDALVAIFNEKFNTRVQRQHDGSHLVLPGKVPDAILKMRRHQMNAIWRGISERFTLYDHVVGSGKTFTAIARVMERRRMGLSKKAMIVVPNHLVEEWTNSVYRLYPGAKVLALGKSDLNSKRRRKVFAKIAAGDQDIVIIPHSSFGFIGIAKETEQRYLEIELLAAEQAIRDAWEASDEAPGAFRKPHTVKQAERLRDKMQARMDRIKGRVKADRLLTFEQLGVDDLTVDEAHEFKNLFYSSRLVDVRGMGNAAGSQKAFDLYSKVRVLRESPTGSVTFMTGTPISNSAVEMYNMMRYLAADELKGLGLEHFDAFRAQFVSTNPGWEPDPTGRLKEVNRLGRTWSNMRSLMDLYYSFTDSVGNDDIKSAYKEDNAGAEFPIPKVKGGDRREVVMQPTAAQSTELSDVMAGFDNLPGIQDPYERNIARLRLWDRARKVSLDVRAAQPGHKSDEKGGKLDVLARQVARIHKAWTPDLGTQLVFLDRSVPRAKGDDKIIKDYDAKVAARDAALAAGEEEAYREALDALSTIDPNEMEALRAAQAGGWNAYQQIKDNLIALGIPASEIRFIQEANNDAQKQALFDAVNAGKVRVLIGSTQRMGAGTNVQQRLVGLHHADVTWKPSDIEQREGRIIRQGNKLLAKYGIDKFEVEILAYATERTIDATMWALNSSKLRTINGIRKYDGAFTMEFDDEESVSMAHLAALASGDPKLMERVKLGSEIDKLELLERANRRKNFGIESSIDQAERNIKYLPGDITRYEEREKLLRATLEALRERVAKRRVTVEGEEFSNQFLAARAAQESAKAQLGEGVDAGASGDKTFSLTIDGKKYRGLRVAQEAIQDALGDDSPFEMVIGGKTYIRRVDAQREIARLAHEAARKIGDTGTESLDLGTFAGLKLEGDVIRVAGSGNVYSVELTVVAPNGKTLASGMTERREDTDFSTAGLAAAVRGLELDPYDTARQAATSRAYLESAHADLPDLLKRRNQPFAQQRELDAKRARIEAVTRELAGTAPVVVAPDVSTNLRQTGTPEANETDVVFADIGRGKLERLGEQIARQGYERATVPRMQAAAAFQKLIDEHTAGTVTDGQFVMRSKVLADRMSEVADTKAANRLLGERVRDVDHVRAQLLSARRKGELDPEAVEFALWALDKNPALAANLGVSIRAAPHGSPAADYNPAAEIIRLFKGAAGSTDTIVHEVLHHAERMMPEDMQAAIRKEWARALATAIRKGTPEQVEALKLVPLAVAGDKAAYDKLVKAIQEGPLDYDKHYPLVNASEFWAVNGARLLGEHHAAKASVWQRIRVWLRELVQKVRALLGLPSSAPIIRALHYVTDASHFNVERGGRFMSPRMLSDQKASDISLSLATQTLDSRAFFAGTKYAKGKASPERAKADAIEVLGFDAGVTVEDESRPDRMKTPMRYDPERRVVLYNTAVARSRAADVQYMIEEMLHAVDAVGSDRTMSASNPRFLPGGDIRAEIEAARGVSAAMKDIFKYPLDEAGFSDTLAAAELFARIGVLYHSQPALLQATAPNTYTAYEQAFGYQGGARLVSGKVRQLAEKGDVVRGEPAQARGGPGGVGGVHHGAAGGTGLEHADGLQRLRRAIERALGGRIDGARVEFGRGEGLETRTLGASTTVQTPSGSMTTTISRSPWLDATNRLQFAPGQWLYSVLGNAFDPLWRRIGFKAITPELKHQLRAVDLVVQKAQETSVAVSQQMQTFSAGEREMVSDIVEQELAAGVIPPAHAIRVAALMSQTITGQTRRLVELDMISEATATRWDGKYLPRFYRSKLRKQVGDAWADAVRRLTWRKTSVMKGIRGNHLKMRGLPKTIAVAELPDFLALGWEIRDAGYIEGESSEVRVWRDWTRAERDARGEERDANFRFVMGYMQTQRDIALGTMFEAMALDPAQSARLPPEGLDWVLVPRTHVDGTGVNRYGKLAGRYVPRETMSHLSQIGEADSAAWQMYRKGMGVWKQGKTALNPASHMNNTVGNTIMAHLAGVSFHRADKYVGAMKDFIWKAPMVKEAHDAGLFLGSMSSTELLDSLPKELRDLVAKSDSRTVATAKAAYDVLTLGLRRPLGALYGAEDTFFRYLLYKDARERGATANDAVDHAQRYIFTYDDLPRGARRVRDFAVPFFAYTYKAAPVLLHSALTHPVRFGTVATLIWVANAAAYAIAAGEDDDDWDERLRKYALDPEYRKKVLAQEEAEQAHLPPWQRGLTAMFTRKVIRLGTDSLTRLPLFIDVSRMIPGNDLAEVTPHVPGAAWLPQPLTPSHPAITFVAGWMTNTDLWTGKPLVDLNDNTAEAVAKRAEWIWKLASPAIAPGNAHWERGMNALAQANGGEVPWVPKLIAEHTPIGDITGIDKMGQPVQPGYAALQTFGIKVRPQDLDTSERIDEAKKGQLIRGIATELYKLKRQNNLGAVNDKQFERERAKAVEKIGRVREGLTVDGAER